MSNTSPHNLYGASTAWDMPSPARAAASAYATSTTSRLKRRWGGRKARKSRRLTAKAVRSIARAEVSKKLEVKHIFGYVQDGGVTNGALWNKLTNISQGLADTSMIGDSVTLEKIVIDWQCKNQAAPLNACLGLVLRIFVFQYLDDDGVTSPSTTSLFEDVTQQAISPWKFDTVKGGKFKILADQRIPLKCYNLDSAGDVATGRITIDKFACKDIQNVAATATGKGHVYFGYVCDTFANGPQLEFFHQTFYTDA